MKSTSRKPSKPFTLDANELENVAVQGGNQADQSNGRGTDAQSGSNGARESETVSGGRLALPSDRSVPAASTLVAAATGRGVGAGCGEGIGRVFRSVYWRS